MRAVRGATKPLEVLFDPEKRIILVFGENGSGKSTLVDAIDLACNASLGSVTLRSSTVAARDFPSVGASKADVRASIRVGATEFKGSLQSNGRPKSEPSGAPRFQVLRRHQLLELVNAEPKNRYASLGSLIGLPGVEKCELSLREAIRDRGNSLNDATRLLNEAQTNLNTLWVEAGSPPEGPGPWSQALLARQGETPARAAAAGEAAMALASAREKVDALQGIEERLEQAVDTLAKASATEATALSEQDASAPELADVLSSAAAFLALEPPGACPVCESKERIDDLRTRVEARRASLQELIEARRLRNEGESQVEGLRTQVRIATEGLVEQIRIFREGVTASRAASEVNVAPSLAPLMRAESALTEVRAVIEGSGSLAASLKELHVRLENELKVRSAVAILRQRETEHLATAQEHQRVAQRLSKLLEIVVGERKAYINLQLADVSAEADRMFGVLHPGEEVGGVRVFLDPNQARSVKFEGMFEGETIAPQAYYSDSHLDTLGLCVFLALAKKDGAAVVLDDVLSSLDGPHLERLVSLLLDEAAQFPQMILTTHYRPILERLNRQGSNHLQIIQLADWSLATGVRTAQSLHRTDELAHLIDALPLDRQGVASKAGVFLEEILFGVAEKFHLRIPMPHHAAPIGALAQGITNQLKPLLTAKVTSSNETVALGVELRALGEMNWVRNQVGSHFNLSGYEVSNAEVLEFGRRVLTAARAVFCSGCASMPSRNAGSYWKCRCGARELHPLTQPGSPAAAAE